MKVYVTGFGLLSSLGNTSHEVFSGLLENKSGVKLMDAWSDVDLQARLGAPTASYDKLQLPRLARRTMSPMSEMASLATFDALKMAGLLDENKQITNFNPERSLLSMGSTTGSPIMLEEYFKKAGAKNSVTSQPGTAFFKVMNHSVASNVSVAIGFNGAVNSPSSACATSAHAAIMGWELIQSGLYDLVICGGADELHYLSSAVFDNVYAASRGYNDRPQLAPRPFDRDRDGLVVSEGASVFVLESETHMKKRGAKPVAEFVAGSYLCESTHMSQSNSKQMIKTMGLALNRAEMKAGEIGYVNAHATGTLQGDGQECMAIAEVFSDRVPVSSLKGHFGHSMAACGIAELIASIHMMESGVLIGTRNLEHVADDCKGVNHLQKNTKLSVKTVLSNNFAFGGINTCVIIRSL